MYDRQQSCMGTAPAFVHAEDAAPSQLNASICPFEAAIMGSKREQQKSCVYLLLSGISYKPLCGNITSAVQV